MNNDLIKVTDYKVLGKLPDPFTFEDGRKVRNKADWQERRKELYKNVIELQYGKQPPQPEFLQIEQLTEDTSAYLQYRITTGKKDAPISFTMYLRLPHSLNEGSAEKFPVVVSGDLCWNYWYNKEIWEQFASSGVAVALFNRTELVPDRKKSGRNSGLYKVYPEYDFGAIGAWAWGYSRCVDALLKIGLVKEDQIVFTGHSRGGKTAALAGALDERAALVHANETCAGACGCYRVHMSAIAEDGKEYKSEKLENLLEHFDFWMGKGMSDYKDCEEKLPFDTHFLKAMIAPRIYFDAQAASDIWGNPIGAWQSNMAAKEVFDFLGVPDNLYWYYRNGYHSFDSNDAKMLLAIIKHRFFGEELNETFFETPFVEPELIFDWKNPNKKGK